MYSFTIVNVGEHTASSTPNGFPCTHRCEECYYPAVSDPVQKFAGCPVYVFQTAYDDLVLHYLLHFRVKLGIIGELSNHQLLFVEQSVSGSFRNMFQPDIFSPVQIGDSP